MITIEFNKRFSLTLPDGAITDAGIQEISIYIAMQRLEQPIWAAANQGKTDLPYALPALPSDWQWVWIIRKGVYAGTFPKRVAQYYFKQHHIKSPPEFLQQLGNIARKHSSAAITYSFDFDQALNWNAGDYGDARSCYWGGKAEARDKLRENGAFAIRFYNGESGIGRAWIAPVEPETPLYVVFNGYGFEGDSTLIIARVFSQFLGYSYKKVSLSNDGQTTGIVWINSNAGYAIATPEHLDRTHEIDLQYGEECEYRCYSCEYCLTEEEVYFGPDDEAYCSDCYHERFRECEHCGRTQHYEDMHYIDDRDVCDRCLDRYYGFCDECEEYYPSDLISYHEPTQAYYCENCYPADDPEPDNQ